MVLAIILLWKGAEFVVESASAIAWAYGISEIVVGLTLVAFGTSAPEFAVTITAALQHHGNISIGNIVGSNIFNLGLILGSVAAIREIQTTRRLVYRDGTLLLGVSIVLTLFIIDLRFTRIEGAFLFIGLILYLSYLIRHRETVEDIPTFHKLKWTHWVLLVIGLGMVIAGGHFLVQSAVILARLAGISEWVIAVTVVAAGTSAPEFVTSLVAALKGRHGISAGNLIGSDLFNMMGVLGLAGMLNPMTVESASRLSLLTLVAMVALVVFFMRTGWKLSRKEGIFLIVINLIRWFFDYMFH